MTDQEMLDQAKAALHRLMIGEAVVECEWQGQKTKFGQANINQLRAYVAELEARIAGLPVRGAMGIVF
ncbi:phage tail protein [Bradyrhizobium tropiciagri]|uniref:gpW family head-tail joining protein n=1 Tax=Bradyrhizobium tropiciagri TaxID=312253 RepID=UPI001BA81662|nr:gpW family head-tail joining protein [Bradyrhizobium tropiciagri]MBR0871188.1 phage tail protein [Bradyrhizobium tropiciagri]